MKIHILKILFIVFLLSPTLSCETTDNENDIEANSNEDDDNGNASDDCTGMVEISNRNLELRDFVNSNTLFSGRQDDDVSRKFMHNNGVFVCTGSFKGERPFSNGNLSLYALDENFDPIWEFPEQSGEFFDVVGTSDNSYVAVGRLGDGDVSEIYVVKVNSNGELIWEFKVDVTDNNNFGAYATSVIENPNGDYIVIGKAPNNSNIFSFGDKSFILSLNEIGEQQWVKPLSNNTEPSDIIVNTDGNFIIGFKSDDVIINEVSFIGDVLNEKTYGSSSRDGANHVLELSDGNYVITGFTNGTDGDVSVSLGLGRNNSLDIWILLLDQNLDLIKEQTFGGFGYQTGILMVEMPDNTLLLCGDSTSNFSFSDRSRQAPVFFRITQDLCLIDWDDDIRFPTDQRLTDAIWIEERNEIVTFSNENNGDPPFDIFHSFTTHKINNN